MSHSQLPHSRETIATGGVMPPFSLDPSSPPTQPDLKTLGLDSRGQENQSSSRLRPLSQSTWTKRQEQFLHNLGAPLYEQICTFWDSFILALKVARILPQLSRWRWSEIIRSAAFMGAGSLPVICVSTSFAGIIITHEIAWHMDKAMHTISMIPGFTAQFILRELGIAIPALLLVSKVGASTTAEIGTMKITEQIDALKLLRIDPVGYLVFPRFIACTVSGACLTLIATALTLGCAIGVAVFRYNFSVAEYINALHHFLSYKDILCAVVKGTIYGAVIPLMSCAYGFRCKGGAAGVGTATTQSVVASSMIIIIYDFLLTYLFRMIL